MLIRLRTEFWHCNPMKRLTLIICTIVSLAGCASITQKTTTPTEAKRSEAEAGVLYDWQEQVIVSQYDDIWERIIAAYQLDLSVDNERIRSQIQWYSKHQSYMDRVADRGVRYLHFISEQIEARDVPGELALLPIVESAFDPFAYSHGRASGVWQFIPSTGRDFGLRQDWWYDGRRDIRAATEAALKYLYALQREFNGDWLLALAAYNSGAGTVRKAIRTNKKKGKATDFWALDLPRETRDYVPKLIALAKIIRDPSDYGLTLKPLSDEPYFAVVNTGGQIDLSQVAALADADLDEIYKLNPGYNRWATHPDGPHEVLVPVQQQSVFEDQLASLPAQQRVKWQRYSVKSGDSLITIARQFHTTPDVLQDANNIRGNIIRAGQQLLIPSAFRNQESYTQSVSQRLSRIKSLRRPGNTDKVEYQVRSGDSFWGIARHHDVTVGELARWNGMAPGDPIKPGQTLVIWTQKATPGKREVIRKINYRVRSGDSLARISQKFNVRMSDLKRWNANQVKNKYLQPGQTLTLYVDVMR